MEESLPPEAPAGGAAALDSIEEYDPVTEIWQTSTLTLDTPRQFHTASSLPDGSIILAAASAQQDFFQTPTLSSNHNNQ